MANLHSNLKNLTDLKALQRLRCLSAEQAQARAFEHLTSQEMAKDEAEIGLSEAIADWDDFWSGDLSDPTWLNILRQFIFDKQEQLLTCKTNVERAKNDLEVSIKYHTQQRDCETDLSKRLRRIKRLFFNQRDELLRDSIPKRQVGES